MLAITITVGLEEINNKIEKTSEAEVVVLLNPL